MKGLAARRKGADRCVRVLRPSFHGLQPESPLLFRQEPANRSFGRFLSRQLIITEEQLREGFAIIDQALNLADPAVTS